MLVMAGPRVVHICSSLSPLSLVLSGETGPMTPHHAARVWVDEVIVVLYSPRSMVTSCLLTEAMVSYTAEKKPCLTLSFARFVGA